MLVGTLETPAQPVELKLHVFCIWTSGQVLVHGSSASPPLRRLRLSILSKPPPLLMLLLLDYLSVCIAILAKHQTHSHHRLSSTL